jgi:hypothetical protein
LIPSPEPFEGGFAALDSGAFPEVDAGAFSTADADAGVAESDSARIATALINVAATTMAIRAITP